MSAICHVVGARPNFMKMAPVILEARRRKLTQISVHTGQHHDAHMSAIFFDELGMPPPDVYLGVGSGSHAEQTARIMVAFERVCLERKPDLVVVGGDVNSTLACALTAAKFLSRLRMWKLGCAHLTIPCRRKSIECLPIM